MVFGHLWLRAEDRGWWKILARAYMKGTIPAFAWYDCGKKDSEWSAAGNRIHDLLDAIRMLFSFIYSV